MTKETILAVDGDIIAYRTAAVCETHFEGACSSIIDSTLRDIATESKVCDMRIYISGANNFRYTIAKTKPYKGNRATMVHPQFLNFCKQYLVDKYKALIVEGYEADDAIATDMTINGAFHCGIDKDMLQIAGRHYNYVKKEWQDVTSEEAIKTLWRQVLMGDASDNVPGLPRIGEKKAFEAIQNHETAQEDAMSFYEQIVNAKLPGVNYIEYMAEQLNLIKMRSDIDIDFKNIITVAPNTEGFTEQDNGLTTVDEPKVANIKL